MNLQSVKGKDLFLFLKLPPSCGLGDRRWPKWHSPQLVQNPHRSWGVGLRCWLIKLHVFIHPTSLGKFFLKDKCSVVLEVWNRRQCTKFNKSNTDTQNYQVKPTVVASGLKNFNQKVYCTTNEFSTAILDNTVPIYNMEGASRSKAYKGLYIVYHRMFIHVKVHEIT